VVKSRKGIKGLGKDGTTHAEGGTGLLEEAWGIKVVA